MVIAVLRRLRAKDAVIACNFITKTDQRKIVHFQTPTAGTWKRRKAVPLSAVLASDLTHSQRTMNASFESTDYQARIVFNRSKVATLSSVRLALFDDGYSVLTVYFVLQGWKSVETVVGLANSLADDSGAVDVVGRVEVTSPSALALLAARDALGVSDHDLIIAQRYTEIDVGILSRSVSRDFSAMPDAARRDLLTLVIRRQSSFREFRLDSLITKYRNQSMYLSDFVCATPHNLMTHIAANRGHIAADFYADRYRSWRVLSAVLQSADHGTRTTMQSLSRRDMPTRLLRKIADESGRQAIQLELWRQSFEAIPQSIAARAKNFDGHVQEMLEVPDLYARIEGRLKLLEEVVMTRYSLAIQVVLQRISIGLSFLALIVALAGSAAASLFSFGE